MGQLALFFSTRIALTQMCTLDQKGDILRGCGFFSKKLFPLLKKRKKNLSSHELGII